jgi:glycosyltransferase involved in cell wall biosynthesis
MTIPDDFSVSQPANFSILIYTPQMWSYGGMERHICLLAELCARSGMRVTLVTTSNSLNDDARRQILAAGVCFLELPSARGTISLARKIWWLLKTMLRVRNKRWDIIYTNGQSGLAPMLWMAASRGTRVIHHHHTAADAAEQKTWHPCFRFALQMAPELVACSLATSHRLEVALRRNDVRFLPCLTPHVMEAGQVHEKTYSPDTVLHFGFVGRLVSTKGIDEICRLSEQLELQGIRWHLYGQGDEYPPSYFEKFPNVAFHGTYRSVGEYAEALREMDAGALYSKHVEGLPLSLMEMMAAGLPWIATDRGGTRELAISEQNSVVIPDDANPDETKMLTMELAARIRAGMTSRISQRSVYDQYFSPKIVGRRWLEFFRPNPHREIGAT